MNIKLLKVKAQTDYKSFSKRSGTCVKENDIHTIINYNCDAYDEQGEPLFFFRKKDNFFLTSG